jgi:hypothetical protein
MKTEYHNIKGSIRYQNRKLSIGGFGYGIMSRLPSHEIETLVEKALRNNITKLIGENDNAVIMYIMDHHHTIPSAELIRTCVEKVTVGLNTVTLPVHSEGFENW